MSTETTNHPPLTKSQKKRLKQKRAKERKAAQAASSSTANDTSQLEPLDPLNAHDAMKIGLQQLGFDLVDINTSIEQMWNLDLDYSDINAVVAFMTTNANANDDGYTNGNTNSTVKSDSVDVNGASGVTTKMNVMEQAEMALKNADAMIGSATTTIINDNANVNKVATAAVAAPTPVAEKSLSAEEESKTVSTSSITKDTTVPQTVANGNTSTATISTSTSATGAEVTQSKSITPTTTASTNDGYINGGVATKQEGENKSQPVTATPTSSASPPATKAPPSLKTKLDIVANNENLMDAIVALTEWIVKAATPVEVKQLCNATEPCALRTVIRRSILTPGSRNFFPGQLLDLIGSILRLAGIPSTEISSSARALMHTFTKAKSAIDTTTTSTTGDSSMKEEIADFVADVVTMNISTCVEKIDSVSTAGVGVGSNGIVVSLEQLEGEIANLQSTVSSSATTSSNNNGVSSLVDRRDTMKSLAQKHSTVMKIKLNSAIPKNGSGDGATDSVNGGGKNQVGISKEDMLIKVFGSKYDDMVASKQKYEELKKRQQQTDTSMSGREEVVSKMEALKRQKVTISERIMELELEIKRLNTETVEVDQQLEKQENALSVLENNLSVEAKEIERQMQDVSHNMKINDSVCNIVDSLQDFQKEMTKVTSNEISSVQEKMPQINVHVELPPQMNAYVASMQAYFHSELKLVSFLQRRANSLRDGFPRMEMEIEECKSLGMTSNVQEMEKKLTQMQQNIVDDDNIIKALQKEAIEMKDTLSVLLSEYKSTGADSAAYEGYIKDMENTVNAIL